MSFKVISVAEIPSLFKAEIEAKWRLVLSLRWYFSGLLVAD